jgi:hypothetical protein
MGAREREAALFIFKTNASKAWITKEGEVPKSRQSRVLLLDFICYWTSRNLHDVRANPSLPTATVTES